MLLEGEESIFFGRLDSQNLKIVGWMQILGRVVKQLEIFIGRMNKILGVSMETILMVC